MNRAAIDSYLNLLARHLTRYELEPEWRPTRRPAVVQRFLRSRGYALAYHSPFKAEVRAEGMDWAGDAETMIGLKRLANIRYCIEAALADGVPGDFLETGAWRGGACIYAAAVLAAHDADRNVWVADSFEGLPPPDKTRYGKDVRDLSGETFLAAPLDQVRANFARYGMLSDHVHFLAGWFADTMPTAPIDRLAVLRLDGDLYSSTMDVLIPMYDKVSPGGFVIIDDYVPWPECKRAVDEFRAERGISDEITPIDQWGVYWRKS